MKRHVSAKPSKNGNDSRNKVSALGRDLRKIADQIAKSGLKPLSRSAVAREVSERRGGR